MAEEFDNSLLPLHAFDIIKLLQELENDAMGLDFQRPGGGRNIRDAIRILEEGNKLANEVRPIRDLTRVAVVANPSPVDAGAVVRGSYSLGDFKRLSDHVEAYAAAVSEARKEVSNG